MEQAVADSQGGLSPALTQILLELWDTLHKAIPSLVSSLPEALTHLESFSRAQSSIWSCSSSPMDCSPPSPGQLATPAPLLLPSARDHHPDVLIALTSDSDTVIFLGKKHPFPHAPETCGQGNTEEVHVHHDSASPSSFEGECSSN
jgi:hypothetical protein